MLIVGMSISFNKCYGYMIALILRFIKSIGMMKLKTYPKGQGFLTSE